MIQEIDLIHVVVADSNKLINLGLDVVLSKVEDISLIAVAESAPDLLEILGREKVDVILMDFTAPGFNLEFIPDIFKVSPQTRVVAITPDQEGATIINALKAGVTSYVKKDCDFEEIISSVRETANGSKFFCGKILETIDRPLLQHKLASSPSPT